MAARQKNVNEDISLREMRNRLGFLACVVQNCEFARKRMLFAAAIDIAPIETVG